MHKKTAPLFVHYGEPEKIEKSFAFNVDIFICDVNLKQLLDFHRINGKMVTITAISIAQRFGVLDINNKNEVLSFKEKSTNGNERINGGYMVLEPEIFDLIEGDLTVLERETLEIVARRGQLVAYKHDGYWQCMDTKREKDKLDELWKNGQAPWKVWN